MIRPLFSIALAAVAPGGLAADAVPVPLPRFTAVELVGGGEVMLRSGPVQRVTLAGKDPARTRMAVNDRGRLEIRACDGKCDGLSPRIEIVTPEALSGIAVRDGGRIEGQGRWPAQASLAVAVSRGGTIDVDAIAADTVAAAVNAGGTITVTPRRTLMAAVSQGGTIGYRGDPAVTRSIANGGAVRRIGD